MTEKKENNLEKKLKSQLLSDEISLTARIKELKEEDPFSDPDHVNDNAAVDTDVREKMGHETIEAQIASLKRKLDNVRMAIGKLQKGKYGYCESCKKTIPAARLKLIPEARYCIACERRLIK